MLLQKYYKTILCCILLVALSARILFLILGAKLYYGEGNQFINNDSFSFTNSFINLIELGKYTFDTSHPDAYYGRLPGYPLFWGAHYILFGSEYVYLGVAITQILLDVFATFLIYKIARTLTHNIVAALLTALIYATYPFIIVWTTITGTELLASFLTILFFYWLICKKTTPVNIIITGVIIAAAFYVREYLGILIASSFLYYFILFFPRNKYSFLKSSFIVATTFGILYSLWPIRNYLSTDRLVLLKTKTSGYHRYGEDVVSARSWLYSWTHNADAYLDSIANPQYSISFPEEVFPKPIDKTIADSVISLARNCGSGFYFWLHNKKTEKHSNCNLKVESGFNYLEQSYKEAHPIRYYTYVPLLNLKKAVFKNELKSGSHNVIAKALFSYRTIIIIISLVGLFLFIRTKELYPLIFFFLFMYLFICVMMRQVEMRYLLQADIILLIGSAFFFARIFPFNNNVIKEESILEKTNA